jgi:hypothetical protein
VIVVQIHTDIISRSLIDVFRSTPPWLATWWMIYRIWRSSRY